MADAMSTWPLLQIDQATSTHADTAEGQDPGSHLLRYTANADLSS